VLEAPVALEGAARAISAGAEALMSASGETKSAANAMRKAAEALDGARPEPVAVANPKGNEFGDLASAIKELQKAVVSSNQEMQKAVTAPVKIELTMQRDSGV
jgi:hypothetical protein